MERYDSTFIEGKLIFICIRLFKTSNPYNTVISVIKYELFNYVLNATWYFSLLVSGE